MPTTYGSSTADLGGPIPGTASYAYIITSGPQHSSDAIVETEGGVDEHIWVDGTSGTYSEYLWSDTKEPVGGDINEAWWQAAGQAQITVPDMPLDATVFPSGGIYAHISASGETITGAFTPDGWGVHFFYTDAAGEPYTYLGSPVSDSVGGPGVVDATGLGTLFNVDPTGMNALLLAGGIYLTVIAEAVTTGASDPTWHYPVFSKVRIYEVTLTFDWSVTTEVGRRPHCRVWPRDDNRGPAPRIFPTPTSAQTPGRITGYQ